MKVNNSKTKKKSRGYILIEATFSIFVVGLTLIAFIQVMSKMFVFEFNKRDAIIASNLAQEGVEIIRNIRDNNWKSGHDAFYANPFLANGTYRVAYNNAGVISGNLTMKLRRHKINGFYSYDGGANNVDTKFSRTVQIEVNGDSRIIISTVTWRPSGSSSAVTTVVEDDLYAWGNPE